MRTLFLNFTVSLLLAAIPKSGRLSLNHYIDAIIDLFLSVLF